MLHVMHTLRFTCIQFPGRSQRTCKASFGMLTTTAAKVCAEYLVRQMTLFIRLHTAVARDTPPAIHQKLVEICSWLHTSVVNKQA